MHCLFLLKYWFSCFSLQPCSQMFMKIKVLHQNRHVKIFITAPFLNGWGKSWDQLWYFRKCTGAVSIFLLGIFNNQEVVQDLMSGNGPFFSNTLGHAFGLQEIKVIFNEWIFTMTSLMLFSNFVTRNCFYLSVKYVIW